MARITHTFTVAAPPERAQALFLRDIVPELREKAGLRLHDASPGVVKLSERPTDSAARSRDAGTWLVRGATAARLKIHFTDCDAGTVVTIRGRLLRAVSHAISLLGQPGKWPETAPPLR